MCQVGLELPVSPGESYATNATPNDVQFASAHTVAASGSAVGSGALVDLGQLGLASPIPRTHGVLQCSVVNASNSNWMMDLGRRETSMEDQTTARDYNRIGELIRRSSVDPNDPTNAKLQFLIGVRI